jgi:hypothetical protein
MKTLRLIFVVLATGIATSCSERSHFDQRTPEAEVSGSAAPAAESSREPETNELSPGDEDITHDCVAFLRSTKTVPPDGGPTADCPQCPTSSEGKEVLTFRDIRVDRIVRSKSSCEAYVTVNATFNPSARQTISGGLTAWISPEQKAQYAQGKIPSDPQVYKVKVIYMRRGNGWRPVEFDRP